MSGPDYTYISLLNPQKNLNKIGGLDTLKKCMYLIVIYLVSKCISYVL